jgi:ribosomal protein S18
MSDKTTRRVDKLTEKDYEKLDFLNFDVVKLRRSITKKLKIVEQGKPICK